MWGIYADGLFFALMDNDVLYFKSDATTIPDFEAARTWAGRRRGGSPRRRLASCWPAAPTLTPELLAVIDTAEQTGDWRPLTRLAELYDDGFR